MVISDTWVTFLSYSLSLLPPDAVYWVNSAWLKAGTPPQPIVRNFTVVTTSTLNSQVLMMYGIPSYIVPRAVDDDVADSVFEKVRQNPTEYEYDFILVATVTRHGHKNEKLVYLVLSDLNALTMTLKICDRNGATLSPSHCLTNSFTTTCDSLKP